MPHRLTKIYTRKGDSGFTSLGDRSISKDDLLIEAIGTVDELNSVLGFIVSQKVQTAEIEATLTQIQHDLFDLGAELHVPERITINTEKVSELEKILDKWNATLPPLQEFVLPRGNPKAAACHIARTVCRRAERCMVRLHRQVTLANPEMLRYLNRLSDVLFVMARMLAKETGEKEILWDSATVEQSRDR